MWKLKDGTVAFSAEQMHCEAIAKEPRGSMPLGFLCFKGIKPLNYEQNSPLGVPSYAVG